MLFASPSVCPSAAYSYYIQVINGIVEQTRTKIFFSTCVKNNDDAEEEESGDAVKNVVDKAVLFSLVT